MTGAKGVFITLEGGEGAGKTTQIHALAEAYRAAGRDVITTREPGGSKGAEAIRALFVTGDPDRWDGMTELLLITAARRDHVEKTVKPALAQGKVVLCDRFIDSTRAYQGAGRGVSRDVVDALHHRCIGLDPDATLILDLSPETGLRRASERGGADRFERVGQAFHAALRAGFHAIAETEPNRCALIDADAEVHEVTKRLLSALGERGLAP